MVKKKSVSIVIPNYNGKQLLSEYLPYTFAAIRNAGVDFEVIIIDDFSTDDSVNFVMNSYPEIILLINNENKGFSYSCNKGIMAARYELILLLNSDVKLTSGYFEPLWKYFLEDDTFGVMGRIIGMDNDQIQDAARMPKLNGLKIKTDYFYYMNEGKNYLYTFYLSGANALIDTAKLKQIGGFYELFSPFYCEDMELGIRAWRLKWICYYEHNAVCRHRVSASTKNYDTANQVKSIYYRNRFYLHAIHLNGWALIAWYLQITLVDLVPKLVAGQTWILKSYRDLFKNKVLIGQYKKKIKRLMDDKKSVVTVFNIIEKLKLSVKNQNITRFNP